MRPLPSLEALPVGRSHALLAPGPVVRRLEGTERLVAIGNAHHGGNFNVVGSVAVRGPITAALLKRALEELQRRHECLQVEVVPDSRSSGHFVFRHTEVAPRLEVTTEAWRSVWSRLCGEVVAGIAWRVVWTPGHLVVLFHHAITDGLSLTVFFDRLLETMSRAVSGISEISPVRQILAPLHRLAGSRWPARAVANISARRFFGGLETGSVTACEPSARSWAGAFRILEPSVADALVARCRDQGVTLSHGLSAAATLEVAQRVRGRKRFTVALCTSVDLRRAIPAVAPQSMGLMSTAVHSFFPIRGNERLWSLAHEAKRQLAQAFKRREHQDMPQVHRLFGQRLAAMCEGENSGRTRDCTLLLSNIGRLENLEHGPFSADALFATASQPSFGNTYLLVVTTVRGRMCVHLGFAAPAISQVEGDTVLDAILGRLGVVDAARA